MSSPILNPGAYPFQDWGIQPSPRMVCVTQVKKRSCLPTVRVELPPLRAAEWLPLKLWLDRSIIIRLPCDQTVPIGLFLLSGCRSQMSEGVCVMASEGLSLHLSFDVTGCWIHFSRFSGVVLTPETMIIFPGLARYGLAVQHLSPVVQAIARPQCCSSAGLYPAMPL